MEKLTCWFLYSIELCDLIGSIFINLLAAFIFFVIFSWIPEQRRRKVIKRNFSGRYKQVKKAIITQFLNIAVELNEDSPETDELLDIKRFRDYFKEDNSRKWSRVLNSFDGNDILLREILIELSILREQISFVLNKIEIHDEKTFTFFHSLSEHILRVEKSNLKEFDYSDFKILMQFIWSVFAGWSFVEGYAESDIIQETINKI